MYKILNIGYLLASFSLKLYRKIRRSKCYVERGYRIMKNTTKVAWATWMNHQSKLLRLFEQNVMHNDIGEYVKRWLKWVQSGVDIVLSEAIKGMPIMACPAVNFYELGHSSSKTTEIYTHITTKGFDNISSPLDDMNI